MQPTYIPWLGCFDLIDQVDNFVFLDNVKLEKSYWDVRNQIKTKNGIVFLTVPVRAVNGRLLTLINEAIPDNTRNWQKKHLMSIMLAYNKARFFSEVYPFLEAFIQAQYSSLAQLNIELIKRVSEKIGIKTKFFIASELKNISGIKDSRLVTICNELNCNKYISPRGAAVYLESITPGGELTKKDISVYYQNYDHPEYHQLAGEFRSHMSIIDLLFNHGFDGALETIRKGRREPIFCEELHLNPPS